MLRMAICDDDMKFTIELETLVIQESKRLGLHVETDVFLDGKTLLRSIQSGEHYSLIFIDIEMECVDGITAARHIRKTDRSVLLIYISGYEKYLKELFEVEPFRFLSKPLEQKQFVRYFEEAWQRIKKTTDTFYQFSFNKEVRKVPLKNIVYFESRNRIINILLKDNTYEHFYGKLNDVEKDLAESRQVFLRIHQSFLVNYDYIRRMNFSNVTVSFGELEQELKISEDRQKKVRQRLCEITDGKAVIEK